MATFKARALREGYPLCVDCHEPIRKRYWEQSKELWGGRCSACYDEHSREIRTVKFERLDERVRRQGGW